MPDDMLAARNSAAGFIGIGLLYGAADKDFLRKEFARTGAAHIIDNHSAIATLTAS